MEWGFIDKSLEAWVFSLDVRWLIRSCISSVCFSLMLNGSICGHFSPKRGLKQGDPLFPILFILCSEILSRIPVKEEEQGRLHGIKVAWNAPAISHLMYADDLLITCRANPSEAIVVKECLNRFCSWSSQSVNVEKSNIFFSLKLPIVRTRNWLEKCWVSKKLIPKRFT